MTVEQQIEKMLAPDRKADKFFKQKIEALNREISEFQIKNITYNETLIKSRELAELVVSRQDNTNIEKRFSRKSRFAQFNDAELQVIKSALQAYAEISDN